MEPAQIRDRVKRLTGITITDPIELVQDTSKFLDISRGMVLEFHGEQYVVLGNMYELRFTLEDYPKYWVKSAIEISSGTKKIVKWAIDEQFAITVGKLNIKCYRSPEKESRVLDLVCDNPHFMHGKTVYDGQKLPLRIIDFIQGRTLFAFLSDLEVEHEEYFHQEFPGLFRSLREAIGGIKVLHDNLLYHGDIRNDHIIIDNDSRMFRWIDFDLNQDFSDFDIWSLGNILLFCAGKGFHTFQSVAQDKKVPRKVVGSLGQDDASAFFVNRVINLRKLFPHVPKQLNDVLMHFSHNTTVFYDRVDQIIDDMDAVLAGL